MERLYTAAGARSTTGMIRVRGPRTPDPDTPSLVPFAAVNGLHSAHSGPVWTAGNLCFPGSFAPEGVRFANFFSASRVLAENTRGFASFSENQPETIASENRHNIHLFLILCRDPIIAAGGNDRGLVGISRSQHLFGICFVVGLVTVSQPTAETTRP
jgi:hypothetical protein